jgi:hypothetical protein
VTREQILNEIETVKLLAQVETVVMQPVPEGSKDYWADVYFTTPMDANKACAELNVPLRQNKWRNFVTQRLPLPGVLCGEIGGLALFEPFNPEPSDTVVVDTQESYVFFSTDELYHTRGAEEFISTKRKEGKIVRRLICKHFDPERRIPCWYGLQCMFVHVKACAMLRLLRTVSTKQKLRLPRNEAEIQLSSWEFERRSDTLLVRSLDPSVDNAQLQYMFEGCSGYRESFMDCTPDGMLFGVVRFNSRPAAFEALLQTTDSGLRISFYGTMEDARRIMMHDPESRKLAIMQQSAAAQQHHANAGRGGGAEQSSSLPTVVSTTTAPGPAVASTVVGTAGGALDGGRQRASSSEPRPLPFPPLPPGWEYGESRKTNQYYFFQPRTKNPTTWQHPITHEHYTF